MKAFSILSRATIKQGYLFLLMAIVVCYYIYNQYYLLETSINSVELVFSSEVSKEEIPIVYISSDKESKINFKNVYKFQEQGHLVYQCQLDALKKPRKLRLYFSYPNKTVLIKSIRVKSGKEVISIPLQKFKNRSGVKIIEQPNDLKLEVLVSSGYIELPKTYIYTSDFKNIYHLALPTLLLLFLIFLVLKSLKPINIEPHTKTSITLSLLILSMFLPDPIYNVALISLGVLHIRDVSWKAIKGQKINLIVLGFFIIYIVNNLFASEEGFKEISTVERFLPFFVLAVVLPSIARRKYLSLFPVSAFVLGFGFLLTSVFDVYIHRNFEFLSFDYFSKYLHPVYFSYLLFFSICFIDLNYKGRYKYILEFVLFVFLIFSGSKMVFLLSLIVVFINLLKNKKTAILILPLALIVVLFSPLKHRFDEILNKEDFTVLNEKHIENSNDARVSGLTLRLLLWRESLATMSGFDYITGKGVTKQTNRLLENRLVNLGLLGHKNFNPHNQYVDTFWRTGVLGLIFLMLIPIYSLVIGIKRKDKLIIQFSLFMFVVMWSESIFGRVNGVYFFTTVILILLNSKNINENSHIRV